MKEKKKAERKPKKPTLREQLGQALAHIEAMRNGRQYDAAMVSQLMAQHRATVANLQREIALRDKALDVAAGALTRLNASLKLAAHITAEAEAFSGNAAKSFKGEAPLHL